MGRPKIPVTRSKYLKDVAEKVNQPRPVKKEEAPIVGVSAQELNKLSQEKITNLIADFTRRDPYNVKGLDPRFRYRFLNRQDDRLDRQTMRGWEIVTGPEADRIAKESKVRTRNGQVIIGDSVLAKIPIEVFVAIRARLLELNRRSIGQSTKTLKRDVGSKYSRNVEESLKVKERGEREVVVI